MLAANILHFEKHAYTNFAEIFHCKVIFCGHSQTSWNLREAAAKVHAQDHKPSSNIPHSVLHENNETAKEVNLFSTECTSEITILLSIFCLFGFANPVALCCTVPAYLMTRKVLPVDRLLLYSNIRV